MFNQTTAILAVLKILNFMGKNFKKNLFNGNKNRKEFQTPKENREIIEATINQEPRMVVIKPSKIKNGLPPDIGGNGAFF